MGPTPVWGHLCRGPAVLHPQPPCLPDPGIELRTPLKSARFRPRAPRLLRRCEAGPAGRAQGAGRGGVTVRPRERGPVLHTQGCGEGRSREREPAGADQPVGTWKGPDDGDGQASSPRAPRNGSFARLRQLPRVEHGPHSLWRRKQATHRLGACLPVCKRGAEIADGNDLRMRSLHFGHGGRRGQRPPPPPRLLLPRKMTPTHPPRYSEKISERLARPEEARPGPGGPAAGAGHRVAARRTYLPAEPPFPKWSEGAYCACAAAGPRIT